MQSRAKEKLTQNVGPFIVFICWARFSEISHLNINENKCKLYVTPNSHQLVLLYWQQMLNMYIHIPKFIFAERVFLFGVCGKIQHVSLRKCIWFPFQDPTKTYGSKIIFVLTCQNPGEIITNPHNIPEY